MGASLTMFDRNYGHLARDGRASRSLIACSLNAPEFEPWTPVDAAWTSKRHDTVNADNRKAPVAD
jgi:hypothetical protein